MSLITSHDPMKPEAPVTQTVSETEPIIFYLSLFLTQKTKIKRWNSDEKWIELDTLTCEWNVWCLLEPFYRTILCTLHMNRAQGIAGELYLPINFSRFQLDITVTFYSLFLTLEYLCNGTSSSQSFCFSNSGFFSF